MLDDFGLLSDEEAFLKNLGLDAINPSNSQLMQMEVLESLVMDVFGLLMTFYPLAFAAKVNNEDTPTYYQAMNGSDCLGFIKGIEIKMQQPEEIDPWEIIPLNQVPEGANILDLMWAFKQK